MARRHQSKIIDLELLVEVRRLQPSTWVFTNGCFDLLHLGHIQYLEEARSLGDVLVVGINTDDSVSRLKGKDRPIKDERTRSSIVAALECVDYVVLFGEDTPLDIITRLSPNVLVKGGDYKIEDIVGHDYIQEQGGKVVSLTLIEGASTSSIIDKIKNHGR